ncbi:MAG: TrkH family potassium uptake protein [Myxococcota bacterium]|nr:TrkH family potassium uptake protein [Myxococcota bacterium]
MFKLSHRWPLHLNLLSGIAAALALSMLPSLAVAIYDKGNDWRALTLSSLSCLLVSGGLFWLTKRRARALPFSFRDGFIVVTGAWFIASIIGALPYLAYAWMSPESPCFEGGAQRALGQEFCSPINAFFEAASGLTTTGASVIERGLWVRYEDGVGYLADGTRGLPRGLMLWRCTTHLLGGMGIVVLVVAVLPLLGLGGMGLFKAEAPGPQTDKLTARVSGTAKLLWKTYLLFTMLHFALLWGSGSMDLYESLCHAMSTMATGGFSTRAASVAGFENPWIEWQIIIFMAIAGMSFNLHYVALLKKSFRPYFEDFEWCIFMIGLLILTIAITIALGTSGWGSGVEERIRAAIFQVLAVVTTTGYVSADWELWVTSAPFAVFILLALMFVGGCAGSTGGGVKLIRHVLLVKYALREFFFIRHPKAHQSLRLNGRVIDAEIVRASIAFMIIYVMLVLIGAALLLLDGQDLLTALTGSASAVGNVGPALGELGPCDSYAPLGPLGTFTASLLMILGRLELYTVLALLSPTFWRD